LNNRSKTTRILSLIFLVVTMVIAIVAAKAVKNRDAVFGLGDYKDKNLTDYIEQFEEDESDESLIELLNLLCYKSEVEKDDSVIDLIQQYGTILYDRVKAGSLDLEELDDDGTISEMLGYIRKYGVNY